MKDTTAVIIFYFICLVVITIPLLFFPFGITQFFILLIGIIAILFQKFLHQKPIRELGFRLPQWRWIFYSIVIPLSILLMIVVIDLILGWIHFRPLQEFHPAMKLSEGKLTATTLVLIILIQWIMTFLAALITEELAFRGYLISRFHFMKPWKAVMISAIIFGVWHVPVSIFMIHGGWSRLIIYIVNISLLGVFFGWLFVQSKSLVPPSIAHGLWNVLEYTFWGMGNEQGLLSGYNRVLYDPEEGVAGTIILLITGSILLYRLIFNAEKRVNEI